MQTSPPKYFKAWIIFFLIATIGGMVIGAVAGGILGFGLGVAQVDLNTIKIVCGLAGFVICIPLSYFTYRWTVMEFIVKELTQPPPPFISSAGSAKLAASPTPPTHNPTL